MNPKSCFQTFIILLPLLLASALWSQSAVPPLPADIPATADHYSLLLMGNPAGQQAIWTAPDGALHIFFQFNDRGRGPKTTSILKLDSKGIPLSETVNGNDYLKSQLTKHSHSTPPPRAGKITPNKAKRQFPRPPTTLPSTERPPKSLSSPRPLSTTEAKSPCFPKAKPASSASRNLT